MCDYIGFPVRQLKRTQIAFLTLQGLKRGGIKELTEPEVNKLLKVSKIDE